MKTNLLRTAFLLIIFDLSFTITKAQWVTIPDAAFVSYLQTTFPACMNGNQMDTTCTGIVNALNVYCSHRPIKNLTGIEYFDKLNNLDCKFDSIIGLNSFPKKLRIIDCTYNQLAYINNLPDSLVLLLCQSNQLTTLPSLPASLTSLHCYANQLTALPVLPAPLYLLNCGVNQLTSLPALPASLGELRCGFNQLTSIPVLPNSLTSLDCSLNPLTSFPVLPNSLTTLNCSNNNLTVLPALPNTLRNLECGVNHIDPLPLLPDSLTLLNCPYGNITSITALPNSLQHLDCSNNSLTTLPSLPNSLTYLNCNGNILTVLPALPDSLNVFDCHSNFLTCLPHLNKVVDFSFYYTNITCLPNYPQANQTSQPSLDTVFLCDPFNANACSINWNIKGRVYNDSSGNCIKDAGETNLHNVKLNLYKDGVLLQQNFNATHGFYSFAVDTGTYTISLDTTGLPFTVVCPASGFDTSVITAADTLSYDRDFAVQCKPGFDLGAWSMVSNNSFQPAHYTSVAINAGDMASFWGQSCNTASLGGQLITTITGAATFISAAGNALPPVVTGNILTYNISDWSAINPNTDFNIVVQTDTTAAINSQICFAVNVTPLAGDNNTINNNLSHCFTVVSSYDPNEKEVSPVSGVDAAEWLTYTIHFQNTGTATAEQIYLTDTLDTNIDFSTFQLLAYSHQPIVQIKDNAVRFNFPNINLPDSGVSESLSHGFVQYRVKLKNNLPVGTHIANTAFIYFDFNPAVVTNTTSNTISTTTTGITDLGFKILDFGLHPNPANNSVTVSMNESMIGSNLTVTDLMGREVLHSAVQIRNPKFAIQNFSPGVYFVTLENERARVTKKLVKQ